MKYYIWSYEHDAWWASDSKGYCQSFDSAGLYTKKQAKEIMAGANSKDDINEVMISEKLVEKITKDEADRRFGQPHYGHTEQSNEV